MKKLNKDCNSCKDYIDFVIPEEIIKEIHNVVFFIGSGISTESKRVFPDTLYENILSELKLKPKYAPSFSKVMSLYVKKYGSKSFLINKIKQRLDYFKAWPELYNKATEFHREVSLFPCIEYFVTTNWDDFLEIEAMAMPFVHPKDIPFLSTPGKKVIKIHGSINDLGSIIATNEDYKKCYHELNKNIVGSKLKLFLAQNIIVFIGYSLQDEDFQGIYRYISRAMNDFKRQAYIVTLDKTNEKQWKSNNLIPIYTEGSYFIYKLRKFFEKKGCLLNEKNLSKVFLIQDYISTIHDRTARKYSHTKFPEIIYSLSYQDGILHALGYLLNKIKGGRSLCKSYLLDSINSYTKLVKEYKLNWLEHSYLKGYLEGLYLFNVAMFNDIKLSQIPLFFYYNEINTEQFIFVKEFEKSLKLTRLNNRKRRKAKKFVERMKIGKTAVFHHIPRI